MQGVPEPRVQRRHPDQTVCAAENKDRRADGIFFMGQPLILEACLDKLER